MKIPVTVSLPLRAAWRDASRYAMTQLRHQLLTTLTISVDYPAVVTIGPTPAGLRRIAPVIGGTFTGERLSGTVLPGGKDWVIVRSDGISMIDVRLTLQTHDDAMVYLNYQGLLIIDPAAMERFSGGAVLSADELSLTMHAHFESGDPRYTWLNNVIAVGTGEQVADGARYAIFAVG
jgi:hypothetical protein